MSLNRIVTRMAVISSLTNFGRAPWPTVAKGLVFDSKIEPSEQLETDEDFQKPIAVVYTDYDKDFMVFRNKLQAPRMMTITLELLVVQASEEVLDEQNMPTGQYELEAPVTDSELELTLDLFERQVFAVIQGDSTAGQFFNSVVVGYENVISRRGAAVTGGQRLAARQTTIETNLLRDPQPGILPDYTRAFLDECIGSEDSDYSDRAAMIKALYLDREGTDTIDFNRKAMGLTAPVAEDMLGIPQRPYERLPALREIRWVGREQFRP